MKKSDDDDIEVIVVNPECIPIAQKKMFDFFYDRYIRKFSEKDNEKIAQ